MTDDSQDALEEIHEIQKSAAEVNIEISAATARIAEKLKTLDEISEPPDFVNNRQIDYINDSFDTLQTSEHEELLNELVRWTKGTKVNFEEYDYAYLNQVESWQQFYTKNLEEKVDGLEHQIGTFDGYLDQMKDKIDYFHNKMEQFFSMLPTDGPYGIMYNQYTPSRAIGPRGDEKDDKIKIYEAQIRCFSDALKKLQELLQGASAEIKKLKQCEAETRKQLEDLKTDFDNLQKTNESKDDLIKKLKDDQEKEREERDLNKPKLSMYSSPAIDFSIGGDEESKGNKENNEENGSSRSQSRSSKKTKKHQNDDEEYDEEEGGSHHKKSSRSRIAIEDLKLVLVNQNVFEIGESEIAQYNEKMNQDNEKTNSNSIEDDEKYKELLEQLKNLKDENDSLKNSLESSSADDEMKKLIEQLKKERDELTNNLNNFDEKNKELQSKLDGIAKEKDDLESKLDKFKKEKENLVNKLNKSIQENEKLNNKIQENENEKVELKGKLANLDEQYQKATQGLQDLKDDLKKTQEELTNKTVQENDNNNENDLHHNNDTNADNNESNANNKESNADNNENNADNSDNNTADNNNTNSDNNDNKDNKNNVVNRNITDNNENDAQNGENSNNADNENNNNDNENNNNDNNAENNSADNTSDINNNTAISKRQIVSFSLDDSQTSINVVAFEKPETDSNSNENESGSTKVPVSIDPESIFHYDCTMVFNSQVTQTDLTSSEIFDKTTYEKAERPTYQYESTQIELEPYPLGIDNIVFYEVKRTHVSTKSSRNDYLSNDDNFIAIRSPHSSSVISGSSFNNNGENDGNNDIGNVRDIDNDNMNNNNNNDNNDIDYDEDDDVYPPFHVKVQYTPTNKNFKKLWIPKPPSSGTPTNSPRVKRNGDRKASSARKDLLNAAISANDGRRSQILAPLLGKPPLAEMSTEFRPRYPLLVVQSLNKPPLGGYRIDSDDVSAFKRRNSGHVVVVPRRLTFLRKKIKDEDVKNINVEDDANLTNADNTEGTK